MAYLFFLAHGDSRMLEFFPNLQSKIHKSKSPSAGVILKKEWCIATNINSQTFKTLEYLESSERFTGRSERKMRLYLLIQEDLF